MFHCNNCNIKFRKYHNLKLHNEICKSIIISIDDICPHKYSGKKAIKNCLNIIKLYPDIKFIFFIPLAYQRVSGRVNILTNDDNVCENIINTDPLYLSKNIKLCKKLLSLPEKNFQFGYHGYFHSKKSWPNKSNNNEFKYLNYDETINKIKLMEEEVKKCQLQYRFSKIFRPPGWEITHEAIKAFIDSGYTLHLNKNINYNLNFSKEYIKNKIFYFDFSPPDIPYNNNSNNIHVVYHACEWLENFIFFDKIKELLDLFVTKNTVFKFLD